MARRRDETLNQHYANVDLIQRNFTSVQVTGRARPRAAAHGF